MPNRYYLIFLVVIFAQVARGCPECKDMEGDEVDGIISDIFDEVKQALKDLWQKVQKAAETALGKIVSDKLNPAIKEIREVAVGKLNKDLEDNHKTIAVIESTADSLHIDITSCIVTGKSKIKKIAVRGRIELNKCLNDKILQLAAVSKGAMDEIQHIKNATKDMENSVEQCGSGISSIPCYANLLGQLLKASVEFPVKITKEAMKVHSFLEKLHPQVKQCAVDVLHDFENELSRVADTVRMCTDVMIGFNRANDRKL